MRKIVLAALMVVALVTAGVLLAQEAEWVKMADVPTTANLYTVTGVSKTKAWAGGELGTLLMWDGKTWEAFKYHDSASLGMEDVETIPNLHGYWEAGTGLIGVGKDDPPFACAWRIRNGGPHRQIRDPDAIHNFATRERSPRRYRSYLSIMCFFTT